MIGGTILGRIGRTVEGKAAHVYFEIRPVGRGAPRIDPKPILDGWKLLEATAIYRAAGKNALYGDDGTSDRPGPADAEAAAREARARRRADRDLPVRPPGHPVRPDRPARAGHARGARRARLPHRRSPRSSAAMAFYTSSGNVSHHSSGNAVDIAMVNGIPILGHQEPGGITDQTINVLLQMQGTLAADQIISLIEKGGPTFAMADHADHIHVGFRPLFGTNTKQGIQALAVLKPGQWDDLIARLREIDNPTVPDRDLEVRDPGQEAPRQRRAPGRIAHFPFVQFEFGFLLGPHDGRYLRRPEPDAEPERVVVLRTLGAPQRRLLGRRRPKGVEGAEAEPGPTVARDDRAREAVRLGGGGRRVARRDARPTATMRSRPPRASSTSCCAATAPPPPTRTRATSGADHALVVRLGYGEGEQVADGRFGTRGRAAQGAAEAQARRGARAAGAAGGACSAGATRCSSARSSCCARSSTSTRAGRARRRCRRGSRSRRCWASWTRSSPRRCGPLRDPVAKAANTALDGDLRRRRRPRWPTPSTRWRAAARRSGHRPAA